MSRADQWAPRRLAARLRVVAALCALGINPPAWSMSVLDQEAGFPGDDNHDGFATGIIGFFDTGPHGEYTDLAQTFTVGLTGTLDRLELQLSRSSATLPDISVDLRLVDVAGVPVFDDGSVLLSTLVPGVSVPDSGDPGPLPYLSVSLGPGLPVVAGERLAIVLSVREPGGYEVVTNVAPVPGGQPGDTHVPLPYAAGEPFRRSNFVLPVGVWMDASGSQDSDFVFRSYVTPIPLSPSLGFLLAALVPLFRRRRSAT